jgi:hypothetical protein
MISPRRVSTSAAGNTGRIRMSARIPRITSKSSTRQLQISEIAWRFTDIARETPRLSSSSAI